VLTVPASAGDQGRPQTAAGPSPGFRLGVVMAVEDARAPTSEDVRALFEIARGANGTLHQPAIRALGRLERRDLITDLLPLVSAEATRADAADALAQALKDEALDGVPAGQQEQAVLDALLAAGAAEFARKKPEALGAVARSIGRLPYERADQIRAAEAFLRRVLDTPFPSVQDEPHIGAARGLESLAPRSRKLSPFDDDILDRLRALVRSEAPKRGDIQRNAMAALIASQGVDAETLKAALSADEVEVRRLAALSLAGSGSVLGDDERVDYIRKTLSDASFMVRYEAVRGWSRRAAATLGCQPLLDALQDTSLHVVLASLDALGDVCRDDSIVTDTVVAESRTPPPIGRWQREAHAFLALAKRAPERAATGMMTFAMHNVWQVRMYAARAAVVLDDVGVLTRLAADPESNVAEVTLPALRKRLGAESDDVFIAVLNRQNTRSILGATVRPYELIRTAALVLKGAQSTTALLTALRGALERITKERCETSRDVRLALIQRIGELGSAAQESWLTPLLKDIDPVVVEAAAKVIVSWTGKMPAFELPRRKPGTLPDEKDLATPVIADIELESGRTFAIQFATSQAPLTRTRFVNLVRDRYYNGLTFHRVVPNFVIQGGSPGANEYCGDCPFMRDEVGLMMHTRGTLGISTRGRDTGDAQIFINLVDNARLDHEYTVFATVCEEGDLKGMKVVDEIQEGDRIVRITLAKPRRFCG
jgi:cyclophilin family peptidyl-prolyl cis-trans isomerase